MSERKVLKYVEMIKKEEKVDHALRRLEQIPMTLEMLSSTGVGKVVNRLKNDDEFGELATRIVEGWRKVAMNSSSSSGRKSPETSAENSGNESAAERNTDCGISSRDSSQGPSSKCLAEKSPNKGVKRLLKPPAQIDAFAAALSSADKVKAPRVKKPRDTYFLEVEKTLTSAVRPPIVLKPIMAPPIITAKASGSNMSASVNDDIGIVKAKGGSHKVYAGRRKAGPTDGKVPRLFDICMRFCINNIDAIEETGDIPFHVLKPVLENCTHTQLAKIESKNRYLEEDTDSLWEKHCQEVFPGEPCGDETWKHCFFRLTHEREERLKRLSAKIGANSRETAQPQRKAMFADPIAPRDARRRQIKNGIVCHSSAVPTAVELSRSRRQIFETGSADELRKVHPAVRNTMKSTEKSSSGGGSYSTASSSSSAYSGSSGGGSSGGGSGGGKSSMNAIFAVRKTAPKKGALMLKTLKMLKAKRN